MDLMKLQAVLNTENGREVIYGILKLSGYGAMLFTGEPYKDSYSAGRVSVANELVQIIKRIQSGNRSEDGYGLLYKMEREELARQNAESEEDEDV
jgi:hypothetical protein